MIAFDMAWLGIRARLVFLVIGALAPIIAVAAWTLHERQTPSGINLAADVAALLVALCAAVWMARRLTAPMIALHEAAERLGQGQLGYRVPRLPAEAGRVALAFNVMAAQLEVQRAIIEADGARFRATFRHCPLPTLLSDLETGSILEVNAAFTEATGLKPREVLGRSTVEIGLWDDPSLREEAVQQLRTTGRLEAFECRQLRPGGAMHDILLYAELLEIHGQKVVLSQVVDVTERKRVQRALAESEAGLRAIFRQSPLPAVLIAVDTQRIVEVNEVFTAVLGYGPDHAIGRTTLELDLWVEPWKRDEAYARLRSGERPPVFETQLRTRSGGIVDMLIYTEVVVREGRKVLLVQAVDLTERKRTERQLQETTQRLTLATRAARIGIWELDMATRRVIWDDTTLQLYGVERGDFGGHYDDFEKLVHPEDRPGVRRVVHAAGERRGDIDVQYRIIRGDGEVRYMHANAHVDYDERGVPLRMNGTTRDVTEAVRGREALARENLELEARVVERTGRLYESVRELEAFSHTVAHDLRAPLRAIDGFSSHLQRTLVRPDPAAADALVAKIRRNVGSMDRLIDGLLDYARAGRQKLKRSRVDMAALAAQARREVLAKFPDVEIVVDALPEARADAGMLAQVWSHLLDNACKFSHEASQPRVAVGAIVTPEGPTYFVRDNGIGFDMRYAERLFGIFERLHADADFSGAGVGLALAQRIVQRHGGKLWAESAPGEGAAFFFTLAGEGG